MQNQDILSGPWWPYQPLKIVGWLYELGKLWDCIPALITLQTQEAMTLNEYYKTLVILNSYS